MRASSNVCQGLERSEKLLEINEEIDMASVGLTLLIRMFWISSISAWLEVLGSTRIYSHSDVHLTSIDAFKEKS